MALTPDEQRELDRLEAAFDEAGGRGVELAEAIDALRQKRDYSGPVRIQGYVELGGGERVEFSIEPYSGWHQWGNTTERLSATVDLMDALSEACAEHLRDPESEG